MQDRELEVKFYIHSLEKLTAHLEALNGVLVQPRTHEVNLRFDTPDGDLTRNYQVLRLRLDTAARLTFKGPGVLDGGVRSRQEIEFTVSSFDSAKAFLSALGYKITLMYEKYRTVYDLGVVHVTLDEMPYGSFLEIEGPDPISIQKVNELLGLNWEARIQGSYTDLFERLRPLMGFTFRDLSFANFAGLEIPISDLGLRPADAAD